MGKQSIDYNKPKHCVWIEFEPPRSPEHAAEVCRLANAMLAKLGTSKDDNELFYDARDNEYCYGGPMGYVNLPDYGHWFNLEYMARATS